jgi:hypothetical protein
MEKDALGRCEILAEDLGSEYIERVFCTCRGSV